MTRVRRYAAGRARALGLATRGTTAPGRLARVDRWLVATQAARLRAPAGPPLVVDPGYGASPVTTVELHARVRGVRPDAQVVGLEIDPERVEAAQGATADGLRFARGGFELAGLRPDVVRAFNVLRQYEEPAALQAWERLCAGLAPGGLLVEGTCDETGRLASWVVLGPEGPRSLVLAAHLPALQRPSQLAERLPKALIHRNVPGERVHALLGALDDAWDRAAAVAAYGPRQRWVATCRAVAGVDARRARHGELTVPWSAVTPRA